MSFLDGTPFIATQKYLDASWMGGRKGIYFRCHMCGYKFKLNDTIRCVYTNDTKGAGGNPLICTTCDGDDVKQRWIEKCQKWREIKKLYWAFVRDHD